MVELQHALVERLRLQPGETRQFLVGWSGGVDSTCLTHSLVQLRHQFPIHIVALHLNFHLRGDDSEADEALVRKLANRWNISLYVKSIREAAPANGVQEWARRHRMAARAEFPETFEVVEAHHADDQIETFFLRLFRGAGVGGLSAMKELSEREGRRVWRPFLSLRKVTLRKYASIHRLDFRDDKSNRESAKYDRNFTRLEILPLIRKRFPTAEDQVLKTVALMQDLQEDLERRAERVLQDALLCEEPLVLSVKTLCRASDIELSAVLQRLLQHHLGLQTPREGILELKRLLRSQRRFRWNAKRDIWVESSGCRADFDGKVTFTQRKGNVIGPLERKDFYAVRG